MKLGFDSLLDLWVETRILKLQPLQPLLCCPTPWAEVLRAASQAVMHLTVTGLHACTELLDVRPTFLAQARCIHITRVMYRYIYIGDRGSLSQSKQSEAVRRTSKGAQN